MRREVVPAAAVLVWVSALAARLCANEGPAPPRTRIESPQVSGPSPATNSLVVTNATSPVTTNFASLTAGAAGRGPAQAETESREQALSLLKNRLVKERVEHVLREFVDIRGYFRAGYGRNDQGTSQTPFQAPGALAKYRLGNETENYGELILAKDWYVPDLFKVDSGPPPAGTPGGPIAHTQLRAAFLDPYSNYGSPDTFQTTLPEVWSSVGNVLASQPELKVWAGNRFYRRHDIHINDFYFLNMSGGGGGVEDWSLPFGKLAVAWIGNGEQSGIFRDLIQSDPNNKAGFSKQNVDVALYDLALPVGRGEVAVVYANETGGRDATGDRAPNANGVALTLIDTWDHFLDENSINKFSLQLGYGAAKSFTSGFETVTATNGTFIIPDDPGSWRVRLTESMVVQPDEHFSIGPALVYQYTDYRGVLGRRHWLSAGVRPILHFNKYISLALEGGVDYVDDSALRTRDYLYKLTVAPQVSLGNLFFSRPAIRGYVTYAGWGNNFRGKVGGPDYLDRTEGWAFGIQMETWW